MTFFSDLFMYGPDLLKGLLMSVEATLGSVIVGVPLGLLLALGVMAKSKGIQSLCIVIVEIGRGTPALLALQLVYFGLPSTGLTFGPMMATIVALGLNTAAYTSEHIRGGLQSVPAGQIEAAASMRFSKIDTLRYIVVPQGFRVAIPPVLGYCILTFQATSLAFTVALPELMSKTTSAASTSFHYLTLFVIAGILYAAVTIPASHGTLMLERRLSRHL